ncbi:hypothetical protein TruAng_010421 [Truncatella angustata]|nr:hypothetical protein TruAng_010421 [Truncatella angustata]
MLGALFEVGPCSVNDNGTGTRRNEYSWTEFANVVFIDQPVGVGLSATNDSELWARDLAEAGVDFSRFLDTFVEEVFPELENRPIHITAESYGGHYGPSYTAMLRRKIASLILVDPFIDWNLLVLGAYEHLCVPGPLVRNGRQFNATACEEMEQFYPSCEKSAKLCLATNDGDTCWAAFEVCDHIWTQFYQTVIAGGWNPYDDRRVCDEPPLCGGQGMTQVDAFLNLDIVKRALELPSEFVFSSVAWEFNEKWSNTTETYVPTTREVAKILDVKQTSVLVINGMNDIGINWEGMTEVLNSVSWSGQARFKTQALRAWTLHDDSAEEIARGNFKWHDRLAIVNVDEAGHMSPHDQPAATSFVMKKWLEKHTLEDLEA